MAQAGASRDHGILFARAYLDSKLAKMKEDQQVYLLETVKEWFNKTDSSSLKAYIASFVGPTLDVLGHIRSKLEGNLLTLYSDRGHQKAAALCYVVVSHESLDQTSKGRNYAVSLIVALKKFGLKWGILTNGVLWRLYCFREKAHFETYFQVDLGKAIRTKDSHEMALFTDFFGASAFLPEDWGRCRLDEDRHQSYEATREIEEHLASKVESVLGKICMGFIESEGRKSYTEDEKRAIFNNSIYLLYRILFILYAEARGFLPVQNPEYYEKSIENLMQIAKDNHTKGIIDPHSRTMWNTLCELFDWINQGNRNLGIPPYNGGLFDDAEKPYLANNIIHDSYLSEAFFSLGYKEDKAKVMRIDYNDLSIRHLGGLYEGILEYQLFIASERMVRRKEKNVYRFIPEPQAGKITKADTVIEKERLYFSQSSEERKLTGSYYTPEEIVQYIVENSLGYHLVDASKELQGIVSKLTQAHMTAIDDKEKRRIERFIDSEIMSFVENRILSVSVLDPAMGSGHFLVNAAYFLANYIVESLYLTEWENDSVETSPLFWRRRVVEKCIFGVDVNDLATELSKLSLWLISADNKKPLTFLDQHLRTGNSLLGTDLSDLGKLPTDDKIENSKGLQTTLNYSIFKKEFTPKVLQIVGDMEVASEKIEDVERKKRKFAEWEELKRSLQAVADTWLATLFNNHIEGAKYESILNKAMAGEEVAIDRRVQEIARAPENRFFHWWLEFPQVFLQSSNKGNAGGFDVVIGNPPYIRVESLRQQLVDIYKKLHESVYQRCDIYVAFIETSFEHINDHGIVGLITGNQYMVAEYGLKIRELLVSKYGILKIVNFTHYSVFPGVSIYSAILVGSRKMQEEVTCLIFESEDAVKFISKEGLSDYIEHPHIRRQEIGIERLRKGIWTFGSDDEKAVLEKIKAKSTSTLSEISLIGSPLKTGRDAVLYFGLKDEDAKYFHVDFEGNIVMVEKDLWRKILRPRILEKWTCGNPETIVFFPYRVLKDRFELIAEKDFQEGFPLTYGLISKFKETLLGRKDSRKTWEELGRTWYSLHRTGIPRNYSETKVLTQSIIRRPTFCIDTKGYFYPTGGVLGIVPHNDVDPYFLLAYLNSNLAYFTLKAKAPPKRGGYISLDIGLISEIPVPSDKKLAEELSSMAIELLRRPASAKEIEDKINATVYSFYEITDSEKRTIEDSLK